MAVTPKLEQYLAQIEDPNLREVLRHIIEEQDQIKHSQVKVIEGLLIQMLGNNPAGINLAWLEEYLINKC